MKTPLEQAKMLHRELKKDYSNTDAMLRLTEFMSQYDGSDKIVPSTDLIEEIKQLENEDRYYTKNKRMDEILDGFRSNQLIVISSPPKSGKTQFCVWLARQIGNATMFLFEESAPEVLYKYYHKGLTLPHFYTTLKEVDMTVEDLYRKMIESWVKYGSRVFFIDHLHFILDERRGSSDSEEIKRTMRELKSFAKRHSFTIFIVAHTTKGHFEEPPGVEAIRDSAHIPALADTVILLWRETYKAGAKGHKNIISQTKNLLVNIALNRKINFKNDRNTGLVDLTFNTDTWEYDESEWYTEWLNDEKQEDKTNDDIMSKINQYASGF